jgi:hypothetical protein
MRKNKAEIEQIMGNGIYQGKISAKGTKEKRAWSGRKYIFMYADGGYYNYFPERCPVIWFLDHSIY